jgi:hypothetical protein
MDAAYEELAEQFWKGGPAGWDTHASRIIATRSVPYDHLALLVMDRAGTAGPGAGDLARLVSLAGERIDAIPFEHPWMTRNVHRFVVSDPAMSSRRLDFVRTWPVLSGLLVDPGIRAAVDAGVPTAPVVASFLGIGLPTARRLVGRFTWHFGHMSDLETPLERHAPIPWMLGAFDAGHLPTAGDHAEWGAFVQCIKKAMDIVRGRRVLRVPPDVVRDMLVRVPARGWTGRLEVLDRLDEARLGDVSDLAMAFRALCLGMGVGVTGEGYVRALVGGRSLVRLYEASERWHRDPDISKMTGLDRGVTWPVPFEAVELGDGWSARCLASNQELVDEGASGPDGAGVNGLGHCVATYAPACLEGRKLVLSLRSGGGAVRETTVELARDPAGDWRIGGRPYAAIQHRASGNVLPGPEAKARLERLRVIVSGGQVPILGGFDERRSFDPSLDEAQAADLLSRWQPYLPARLAGLPVEEFRAALRG